MQSRNHKDRRKATGRLVGKPTATLQGYTSEQRDTLRQGLRVLAEQHDESAEARRYITFHNDVAPEALPEPGVLQAADWLKKG